MSGSGPLGFCDAQMDWLGQPAQAEEVPAEEDSGPGQWAGSGAMRAGLLLMGLLRTEDMAEGVEVMGGTATAVGDMISFVCGFLLHGGAVRTQA